jgi:serine/threonine protein kinase/tetratricopeptide (TPR) repeat protein
MIDEPATAAAGQIIGYYKIVGPLDKGGMGEVYLATDTRSGREVALKLLPDSSISDQQRVRRFQQEARSILALNHPNIVTIYEIGQTHSAHYIVTERITGETLRQRLARAPLEIPEALAIAIEVAKALEATHAAGIMHRDIKPENIMIRPDGYVKVLDFGIAKLTEQSAPMISTEAATMMKVETAPGVVMGTVYYMSPEQARGRQVDARTDIWSLGAVLYEMAAGRPPFEGKTPQDIIILIAGREPAPIARYAPYTPTEFQRIVSKALTKDREERYQTAKDLLIDLKGLKKRLEMEAEIERTVPPELRTSASEAKTVAKRTAANSTTAEAIHHVSSAEYIVSEIKRHKKGSALTAAVALALVLATAGYFMYPRRTTALTDKDTILLADFVNTTSDPVFDGTLKQALAVQLGQSPFLDIFSDDRVSDSLKLMGRAQGERVNREIGREICQRQGLKAMLAGSIASLGSNYVMTLEVINAQTGDVIAREQTEAQGKEQVLRSLGEASTKLREKLGESLASIQKFDAPLEQVTTSSLEALKAYSLAKEKGTLENNQNEAIPLYKRAVELDPNFAVAYAELSVSYRLRGQPELAIEPARKAFELRERAGERERLLISLSYYSDVTKELDKQLEVAELRTRTYPRDYEAANNLGVRYRSMGLIEKSIEEFRESIRRNPKFPSSYMNMARGFVLLNRLDEALPPCRQTLELNHDFAACHDILFQIAFIQGDTSAMKQHLDWYTGRPNEFGSLDLQADVAAFAGQLRKALDFEGRASDMAEAQDLKERAAQYSSLRALLSAVVGDCRKAREDTTAALSIGRTRSALSNGALAFALCGESGQAQALAAERAKLDPADTLLNAVTLPLIRAELELQHGSPSEAVRLLQSATQFERMDLTSNQPASSVPRGPWPAYVRGQAYLRQQAGAEAMAEFQKVLDRSVPVSILHPLAELGLARAAVLQGDAAKARKAYQDFFALWKDADTDVPILQQAKQEYEKLK